MSGHTISEISSTRALRLPDAAILQRLAISETGFVFDPVNGNSFTLNGSGLALLRLFQTDNDLAHVCSTIVAEFDISERDAERDIIEFATQLCESLRP